MAHMIEEHDTMFSVKERPWHGLGTIILTAPDVEEAKIISGLNWKASIQPLKVPMITPTIIGGVEYPSERMLPVEGHNAIVRNDKNIVLGIVGNRYEIYQNDDMWSFIDAFQKQSGIKLETAGSLKNGRTTWVLAKNGANETIKNDPIDEFFLFRNSFDGTTPISCMFTNIRVVCNNTLTAALKGARNIFNVRHTGSTKEQIYEVQKALGFRQEYQANFKLALEKLSKYKMGAIATDKFLSEVIFPKPRDISGQTNVLNPTFNVSDKAIDIPKMAVTIRANKIESVLKLVESGRGSDIPGVKGTAYGLWNALTEYSDWEKQVKVSKGRDIKEVKFENAFFGTGATFKNDCFQELMKIAA